MFRTRKALWIVVFAALLAAGGGYYYWAHMRGSVQAQTTTTSTLKTTRVRRGELVLSATGVGNVVAATERQLAFPSSGLVTELHVQIGDRAEAGDILARIDDLETRKALTSAELQVVKAQLDLDAARIKHNDLLEAVSETELLDAQAALLSAEDKLATLRKGATAAELSSAEAALGTAQKALNSLINGPDPEDVQRAQWSLEQAKNSLWSAQMGRDAKGTGEGIASGAYDQAQVSVLNAEIAVRKAEMDLADLLKPVGEVEIQKARADVASAQEKLNTLRQGSTQAELAAAEAALARTKTTLQELEQGPSAEEVAASAGAVQQAELSLASAKLALEAAQRDLEGSILKAPFAGTVMSVAGQVGDKSGTGAFITLADISVPFVEFYLDETDLAMMAVGYEVEVEFDALPEQQFKGHIVRVEPQLVTVSNTRVLRGLVALDAASYAKPQGLIVGLNATLDVIGGRAENALLVPVEALRDLGGGEYAVFVVEDNQPKLRVVQVGLMDLIYAEIKSGLGEGETVSTGLTETR
jgi:HlyD family secretion protein